MDRRGKKKRHLSNDYISTHVLGFFRSSGISFRKYCGEKGISSQRVDLRRVMGEISFQEMKTRGANISEVELAICNLK